jgi:hypothetical protein
MQIISFKTHWNRLSTRVRLFLLALTTGAAGALATLCLLHGSLKEVLYKAF